MNENTTGQPSEKSNNTPAKRPNETGSISVEGFVRIFDPSTNEEILKYDLGEDFSIETVVEFGELYRKEGAWKFKAIGTGFAGGLQKFVDKYC